MLLKFYGPGMSRNRPGIVPMLATTFLCSVYISFLRRYFDPLPWRFLVQPELQQGSDRLNCNQKHFLMLCAIKLIAYTSMNKSWAYFRVICAPIRSWSDAIYPSRHPEKTSHGKISWSLEAARFVFRIVRSLWNLTGTSTVLLPMCLSNFKAIRQFKVPFSWLRNFTRSDDKTSFRIYFVVKHVLLLC